jgi:NAD(P)-dependent dehydrogenase (short-subunit alcohol dehydrogenase family)
MGIGVLNAKVALITGSSRGIGRAIALKLASEGADIIINYRKPGGVSEKRALELLDEIKGMGRSAWLIKADISSPDEVKEMFRQVHEDVGRLDFLILNAARAPFKPLHKLFRREIRQLVETNYEGNLFCVQQALPLLEKAAGRIIFVSSLGSRFYNPTYPLGSMKAAMEALIRDLAEEFRERGINANAVCGGIVKTDSFKVLRQHWEGLDKIPDDLLLMPEDMADAVYLLCLPEASCIRGQTIVVDKGLSNVINRGIS